MIATFGINLVCYPEREGIKGVKKNGEPTMEEPVEEPKEEKPVEKPKKKKKGFLGMPIKK